MAPAPPGDLLEIVGARLENRSQAWVSSATLGVPATGRFVSCGNIAPGAECATSFPELAWSGNPVELNWNQGGQLWSTGEVSIEPSADVRLVGRAVVRVVIMGPGSAGVVLQAAPPSG